MNTAGFTYEQVGAIARLLHDRPQARNAQSAAFLRELEKGVDRAIADPDIRVIVIAGKGDHFCAGHDLKDDETQEAQQSPEARYEFETRLYLGLCLKIWDSPKPVIAEVQGACIAGGFMTANMCDLVVASEDAFFADPVVGAVGVAGVEVMVHPWVMGLRRAKEFLFLGARVTATEAHAMGMVNRVVPRVDLTSTVMEMAERMAQVPPFGMRLMKKSLNRTADIQGFRAALEASFDTHQLSHMGTEQQARVSGKPTDVIEKMRQNQR